VASLILFFFINFLWMGSGGGYGGFFIFFSSCVWCREWTAHCSLSTWPVGSQVFMHAFICLGGEWVGVRFKAKSSQVPDMFPKEFPIVAHFYPNMLWQMLSSFHYIARPKESNFEGGGESP